MSAATYDKSYWQDFIFEQGGGILCNNSHEFAEVMQALERLGFIIGFEYMKYLDQNKFFIRKCKYPQFEIHCSFNRGADIHINKAEPFVLAEEFLDDSLNDAQEDLSVLYDWAVPALEVSA